MISVQKDIAAGNKTGDLLDLKLYSFPSNNRKYTHAYLVLLGYSEAESVLAEHSRVVKNSMFYKFHFHKIFYFHKFDLNLLFRLGEFL